MTTVQRQSQLMIGSAVLAILGATTLSAHAQFLIDPATNVFVGTQPSGVAAGDFDGDGDVDLATTVDNPDRMVVLLNSGAGQYALGASAFLPASSSPQDVIAGDLDGDGDIDVAVALRDPVGAVVMMINNGAAMFTMGGSFPVGDRPRGLAIADMDGDGDLDLAVANRDSGTASVLINNGAGGFSVSTLAVGSETRATAFVDFDLDGDLDLAVTDHGNRTVATFTNNGGSFTPAATLFVGPFVRPEGIVAADLDGDGDDDLAVATSDQTFNINQASIFINIGAGFSGPFNYDTGGLNTSHIVAADMDCDGLPDLAATNKLSNNVSMLRNLGGAIFSAPMFGGVGTSPGEIAAADLDGDGDPDLAVANRDSGNVSVLINQTCLPVQPCPWDIDGSGSVGITDLLSLLSAWGTKPGGPPDFDGGGVGITDLLAMLANWGPCA